MANNIGIDSFSHAFSRIAVYRFIEEASLRVITPTESAPQHGAY